MLIVKSVPARYFEPMPKTVQERPDGSDLITSAQAAEILCWSVTTVNRQARVGKLPAVTKLSGATGSYVFDRADIEALAREEIDKANRRAAELAEGLGRTA